MMKKILLIVLSLFVAVNTIFAQNIEQELPPSFRFENNLIQQPQIYKAMLEQNASLLRAESMERVKNGQPLRIAVGIAADLELISENAPLLRLASGEQIRRQAIKSEGANGLILSFSELFIPEGGKLFIYTEDRTQIVVFLHETNPSGGVFATSILYQDKIVLEYVESIISREQPRINISNIGFVYRSNADFRNVMTCYINANCSEGDDWLLQRNGVVGLRMNIANGRNRNWYICSGSLINNVRQDGTPFILSASHCFEGYDDITLSTMAFDFFKESVSDDCTDRSISSPLTKTMTGAIIIADIPMRGASDGTLLKLTNSIPNDWNVFFNGWDARGIAATSGVSIHHPNEMVKKISTFTQPLVSVGNLPFQNGIITGANAHWQVRWSPTENGHSVTFGGSSGSPIFNENGHIVGTLSGGASFCQTPNAPDFYGKFSHLWNQYSDTTQHFRRFLDPDNTGVLVLDGFDPNAFDFENNTPIATYATNITSTEFTANWLALENATRYYLDVYKIKNDSIKIYLEKSKNVGSVTSFTIDGLTPLTQYYYVVRAGTGIISQSKSSNEISIKTHSITLFPPVATEATMICANSFQANWEATPEATTYFLSVFRKENNDEKIFIPKYEFFNLGNVLSHTVEGLEENTRYYYVVVASNGTYFSRSSNEIGATTTDGTSDICNPRIKSAVFVDNHNIIIYSASEMNLAIYNIAGQLLLSKNIIEGETIIPKNNFPSGVYFVRLGIETHKILVW